MNSEVKCEVCDKTIPVKEAKHVRIKSCCSTITVTVCAACLEVHNYKKNQIEAGCC